jgi:hypothetical protein
VSIRRRYDLGALVRRVAAHFGRKVVSGVFGSAGVVAGLAALLDGSWSVAVVAGALVAASVAVYSAPDWVFEAPDPWFERGSVTSDGMTDKEVMRRFAIATEREAYKEEKREEARKRQERKQKARRAGR